MLFVNQLENDGNNYAAGVSLGFERQGNYFSQVGKYVWV